MLEVKNGSLLFRRLGVAARAVRELGLRPLANLAIYRLGLITGHYRRITSPHLAEGLAAGIRSPDYTPLWRVPSSDAMADVIGPGGREVLLAEAERILTGRVKLFGMLDSPLKLVPTAPLVCWTAYNDRELAAPGRPEEDIKFVWEPARFGWVFTLGRAFLLTGDNRYPAAFWKRLEEFMEGNPAYLGPHWISAQEVALRLIAFTFALQVFQASPESTPARTLRMLRAIAIHAGRIPVTLAYARAQNNNHLLSEAAGLVTAGMLLANHPQSHTWRALGWRLFNDGLHSQIDADGAYCQHSANYHRLMLQLGLWIAHLEGMPPSRPESGNRLDNLSRRHLKSATEWLLALLDPASGRVPNLGPNDGAYIFPLAACGIKDYRPVLQAAAKCFRGAIPLPGGLWDEMGLWLGGNLPVGDKSGTVQDESRDPVRRGSLTLCSPDRRSWAYLRAARFTGRPGHADQLHLDLWHNGVNLALDPGTYLYNAAPPWDNSLTSGGVHNTVSVDGRDQMLRAGRFLYLDWAQAKVLADGGADESALVISAEHDGYRAFGLRHRRTVRCVDDRVWEVEDVLAPRTPQSERTPRTATLHWLLPDWPWSVELDEYSSRVVISLDSPHGRMRLELCGEAVQESGGALQLARAGEVIYGEETVSPTWGWFSPTYAVKQPALSARLLVSGMPEIRFRTRFILPVAK